MMPWNYLNARRRRPRRPAYNCSLPSILVITLWYCIFTTGALNSSIAEAFTTTAFSQLASLRQCADTSTTGRYGLHLSNSDEKDKEEVEFDPRDNFGRSLRGFRSSALKTNIEAGDTVVCKRSLPDLGIYADASYEVMSIYTQDFDGVQVVKQPLESLDDAYGAQNQEVYMTLFSPIHHEEAVVVTPEEVGLVSIREELGNAAWLAIPGFFWVFVAASFYNTYHERTGGSFGDAFWGR